MIRRIVAGLVALVPVLSALWFGGVWWVLLVVGVTGLGAYEYYALMIRGGYRPARWLGIFWTLALVLSLWQALPLPTLTVLTVGFITVFIRTLYQPDKPFRNWAITVAGASYLGLMMGQALALRLLPLGLWWLLLGLAITMINDTAAYFVGVTLGRHKIWPALSPKKSWEGTIGGWVAATLTAVALATWTPLPLDVATAALVGLAGGILALFGDLSISMLKRQIGVKDSGTFLPGHGGMLDRLDSIMFVLPFVYQVALLASL